jgi:uncharacterized protein (TIGR03083 family)
MGMNDEPDVPPTDESPTDESPTDEVVDLLAAHAIDAAEPADDLLISSVLAGSAAAMATENDYRIAAGEYAAVTSTPVAPPPALRARVLEAAFAQRPGQALVPSSAADLHRLEADRTIALFRRLRPADAEAVVDPPELAGWTVRDLVIHILANETLLAEKLGTTSVVAPETETDNLPRTEATWARFEGVSLQVAVDEYADAVRAIDERIAEQSDAELDTDEIDWWGAPMRLSTALIVRTFETWTHGDDIRRALGLPQSPPPAPDLATMSARSLEWVPLMLAGSGVEVAPSTATVVLTGPGGDRHEVQLGGAAAPEGALPRFELTIDVVDYCRAVASRLPTDGMHWDATGDTDLAATFVGAVNSLAQV